jgi:hypothetical protein
MSSHDDHLAELQTRLERVVADAPDLAEVLRGTVGERFVRCGKPGCRCQDGPGHGPVYYVSISLGAGKTKQVTLSEGDYDLARRYADNYSRLREIVEEVSAINREILRERRKHKRKQRAPVGE